MQGPGAGALRGNHFPMDGPGPLGAQKWAPGIQNTKNGPPGSKNKYEIFANCVFKMCFSSGIGSGPSRMALWTPWIDIKIQLLLGDFWLTFGWLYSTI